MCGDGLLGILHSLAGWLIETEVNYIACEYRETTNR